MRPTSTPLLRRAHRTAALASAGLLLLSAPSVDLWPLFWIALVPLLWATDAAGTARRAAAHGFAAGCVFNAGCLFWLYRGIGAFWRVTPLFALPLFALLVAWRALLFAGFAGAVRVLRDATGLPFALLAPPALVAMEFALPSVVPVPLAAFQAWVLPVVQIAELVGPLGVTFCAGLVNGAIFDALLSWKAGRGTFPRPVRAATLVMAAVLTFGFVRMRQVDARWAAAPKLKVGLVQTNVARDDKPYADRDRQLAVETTERLLADATARLVGGTARLQGEGVDLVVWPETSFPRTIPRAAAVPGAHPPQIRETFRVPVLAGAVTRDEDDRWFNSALLLQPGGAVGGRYDKQELFLLGERIPLLRRFPVLAGLLPDTSTDFTPGAGSATLDLADPRAPGGAWRLGPFICVEDMESLLGVALGRLRPHLLVTLGNDAWFGDDQGPWGHLAIATFRAVEQRVGLVRAMQTGASAVVDATGRVRKRIAPVEPRAGSPVGVGTVSDEVAMMEGGHTIYASIGSLWGRADLIGLASCAFVAAGLGRAARDRRRAA